ncbi:MAG: type 4a pilus biogenesis protein PilO [Nitrospirota bacterium]
MAFDTKLKLNLKDLSLSVKIILALLPSVLVTVLVVVMMILPKNDEIKLLDAEIINQEKEIAKDKAKVARLASLKIENERLIKRLNELKLQLPEEKEVSGLLKQVSDLGIKSGLRIISWKPDNKRDHPSGIIYEIPVLVELSGSYHSLGMFFSSLTKLNRIVNISDIRLGDPVPQMTEAMLKIAFRATTFSAVPESEIAEKTAAAKKEKKI